MKLAALLLVAGCVKVPHQRADAMRAEPKEPLGEDRLSLHWKFETADRRTEVTPQEFAQAAVYADTIFVGSASGYFFALKASNGAVRWKKKTGAIASAPLVGGSVLYLGTSDGVLMCLDSQTGEEKWRYQSRGPISQRPSATQDLVVFSNESDQVVAVDAITGKFKWQFKGE
ncbi:MAG: PQQ-like beta-propeller repeat protein, partial [Deltaproteobacteria bacterium]|nr:PQQ-like beta-propeller repeat protein [Deltaproteobacteria bacterium]